MSYAARLAARLARDPFCASSPAMSFVLKKPRKKKRGKKKKK